MTKTLFSYARISIVGAYSGGKKALRGLCRSTIGIFLLFSLLICLANISQVESESYSVSWTSPNTYSWGVELNTTIGVGFIGHPSIVELNLSPEVAVANQTTNLMDGDRSDIFYLEESLQPLTYYTATLVYGEEDDLKSYIWIFISEDLLLWSVSPKPGSSNVNLDIENFYMKFAKLPSIVELMSEPEVPIKDTIILIFSNQSFPPDGSDHYIFVPDESLQHNTTYTTTLVFGEENNTRSFTWNFTTGEIGDPAESKLPYAPFELFPESGSIDVPLDANISISISRPPAIVNMSIFPEVEVKERIDEVIGFNGRYTFILSELLESSVTYNVTIIYGDYGAPEGFTPTNTITWNFTTVTEPKEPSTEKDDPVDPTTTYLGLIVLALILGIIISLSLSAVIKNKQKKHTHTESLFGRFLDKNPFHVR